MDTARWLASTEMTDDDNSLSRRNLIGMIGLIFCYHPPPRPNAEGLTKMEIVKRIDWLGAFLSIVGITLFSSASRRVGTNTHGLRGKPLAP